MEDKKLNNENELIEIKHQRDLARFGVGNILINDQDLLRNNADDEDAIADVGPNADNAPKYKPSIRLLLCTPNFQKRGKNIFKHNKYFKVLYRTDVTQNNKHHLIVDMKTEPTSRKNWSELKEFCSNGTKSYESRKIRDQNQLNDLKIKHNMIQC